MTAANPTASNECLNDVLLDIPGCGRVLFNVPDAPIVFLIDEFHKHEESTSQNISAADTLVRKANVHLIGVESHRGGREWDDFDGKYQDSFDDGENPEPVNDWPKFADAMRSSNAKVVGVECYGMMRQQETESITEGISLRDHALNQLRSEHFIRTLVELHRRNGGNGNLILNCGGEHSSHINKWIEVGTIEARVGQKASYVSLRAPTYPG